MTTLTFDMTVVELLQYFQKNALPLSKKIKVLIDDADDVNSINQSSKAEIDTHPEFYDFSQDEFVGMWADREDMADSVEYVRKLRQEQWG